MTPPVSPRGLAEDKADGAGTAPTNANDMELFAIGRGFYILIKKRMDNDEIAILREQLSEKDKQIVELKSIINKITQFCSEVESKEDAKSVTQNVHKPGFLERYVIISQVLKAAFIIFAIAIYIIGAKLCTYFPYTSLRMGLVISPLIFLAIYAKIWW